MKMSSDVDIVIFRILILNVEGIDYIGWANTAFFFIEVPRLCGNVNMDSLNMVLRDENDIFDPIFHKLICSKFYQKDVNSCNDTKIAYSNNNSIPYVKQWVY